jgi:hypothetical protein
MPGASHDSHRGSVVDPPNVAQRLKNAVSEAKQLGFDVRQILLDEEKPGWCQFGETKLLFFDLGATAAEQLQQIAEILASYQQSRSRRPAA